MGNKKDRDFKEGVCEVCNRPFFRPKLGKKDDFTLCRAHYMNKILHSK